MYFVVPFLGNLSWTSWHCQYTTSHCSSKIYKCAASQSWNSLFKIWTPVGTTFFLIIWLAHQDPESDLQVQRHASEIYDVLLCLFCTDFSKRQPVYCCIKTNLWQKRNKMERDTLRRKSWEEESWEELPWLFWGENQTFILRFCQIGNFCISCDHVFKMTTLLLMLWKPKSWSWTSGNQNAANTLLSTSMGPK